MPHFVAILILLGWAGLAPAASFSCAAASTPVEKLICSDRSLSRLDETMAARFKNSLASAQDAVALRDEQRAWLTGQRNACSDAACLSAAYQARISQLGGAPVVQPTPSHSSASPLDCAVLDRAVKTALNTGSPAVSLSRFGNRFVSAWRPSDFDAFIVTLGNCKMDAINAPTLNAFPQEAGALLDTLRHRATSVGSQAPSPALANTAANEPSTQADISQNVPSQVVSEQPASTAPTSSSISRVTAVNPAPPSSTSGQPSQAARSSGSATASVAATTHPPSPTVNRSNKTTSTPQDDTFALTLMGIVGVWLVIVIAGIVCGWREQVVVFRNFNDLALMFLMITLGVGGGAIGMIMLGNSSKTPALIVLGVTILVFSGLLLVTIGRTWNDNNGSVWRVGVAYVTKMSLGILFIHNVMAVVTPGGDTYLKRAQNRSSGMLWLLVLTPIVLRLVRFHEGFWTPRNVLSPYHQRRLGV